MWSFLALAIVVGMHHALEADHVAAVSSLVTGKKRWPDVVAQGLTWGVGHTATLFLFAGISLILGHTMPDRYVSHLESAVGLMLIGLGSHVVWRVWRDRIHFHTHRHGFDQAHFHAHSHAADTKPHDPSYHYHAHRFNWRTLFVGMTHGLAGSAALLVLAVSKTYTGIEGLAFILLFGIGSMLGMTLVSAAIGVPLLLTARFFTMAHRTLQVGVGLVTIIIGSEIVYSTLIAA